MCTLNELYKHFLCEYYYSIAFIFILVGYVTLSFQPRNILSEYIKFTKSQEKKLYFLKARSSTGKECDCLM